MMDDENKRLEGAELATLETQPEGVSAWDETLRAIGYDELRTWVLERLAAGKKEGKILQAMSEQLDHCANMRRDPMLLQAGMKQAKHMRGEVLNLRGEQKPDAKASTGPTPAEVRAAVLELEQMEVQLFQLKDRLEEFSTRFERAFRVLGKLAP
jgi:hypothetical protein